MGISLYLKDEEKPSQAFDLQEINPFVDEWEEAGAYPAHKVSTFLSSSFVKELDLDLQLEAREGTDSLVFPRLVQHIHLRLRAQIENPRNQRETVQMSREIFGGRANKGAIKYHEEESKVYRTDL